jgi:LytS/YehU family sensor histidine kinase
MVTRLSDFLRLAIDSSGVQEVTLKREMEFLDKYLEIEQVRFGERLTTHFEIGQETWAARVPHLILQPLIENAIRHGLALREEGGSLTIGARRVGSRLQIEVVNDGCSAPPEGPAERERIGLANTRQRLRYSYGDDQRLEVETVGGTVRVVIELPFRTSPASA